MEVSRQLCSCFLLLLVLFVLSVKSDNSVEKVNSAEIDSDHVGNNTRTARRMMKEVPLLIIRPMQEQKRTIFIMDHKHHKKHIAPNHMPMNSHSEFYVKEGEIFSLEKMLPFFGIDTKRGYKSNIKKGNMNHFLSTSNYNKPTASKLEQHPKYTNNNNNNNNNNKKPHYTKPDHQFLINPIPVNSNLIIADNSKEQHENKITPTTSRPQQQQQQQHQQQQLDVKPYKQEPIYHGNSVNYPNMIQTSATYVNPPEIYYNHHNDIIVGQQMGDKIKPPPTIKKEYFNNNKQQQHQHQQQQQQHQQQQQQQQPQQPQQQQQLQMHLQLRPYVHTNFYVPKTVDYAENRNKQQQLHYQQKEQLQFQPMQQAQQSQQSQQYKQYQHLQIQPLFAQSKHQMHNNLKPKASAYRQNPQIEYFFPQDQNYADININTDMEKSVKMAAEQQHEAIPISKFYSSVKYQKPEPLEIDNKYFETSSTKQFEVQSEIKVKNTEVQMNPLAELSQGYVQDVKMELKNEVQVDGKSSQQPQASKYTAEASERYETEVKPSFGIIVEDESTTTENFPTTTNKSKNRKIRKRNRKSSTTTLIPDEGTVEMLTEKNQFMMKSDTTTINPFSCERGCIKKLTSKDYDPVCGSDGKTYYTKSKLRCAQTCRRDDLTIKSFGVCGKSPEAIVDIKYNY